ncbi:hypothetical protein BDK51DRAFT_42548 [Blyttiomyces helicus]|uniref:Armadillo-type protein n=1 Tax=Blyttiomyces helicus TaxID=388810 RepID=A0A4P9WS62_9FUNG|nr:hypothetical protein BDK51DRAFT_42548 [Blyttiomyces helicus]|eukprot:RKO94778.1 hypothetical protein BDK51DRAFT_42548 [Blyttiomyces helicus]
MHVPGLMCVCALLQVPASSQDPNQSCLSPQKRSARYASTALGNLGRRGWEGCENGRGRGGTWDDDQGDNARGEVARRTDPPSTPDPTIVNTLVRALAAEKDDKILLLLLAPPSPLILRTACARFRKQLGPEGSEGAMRRSLDVLVPLTRALSTRASPSEDADLPREVEKLVRALMLLIEPHPPRATPIRVGALRVMASLLAPSSSIRIRVRAFKPSAVLAHVLARTNDTEPGIVALLVDTLRIDARPARYYALRCLTAVAKNENAAKMMGRVALDSLLDVLSGSVEEDFVGGVDDVPVLCSVLLWQLLQARYLDLEGGAGDRLLSVMIAGVRAASAAIVAAPALVDETFMPPESPDSPSAFSESSSQDGGENEPTGPVKRHPSSTIKFLQHALDALSLGCEAHSRLNAPLVASGVVPTLLALLASFVDAPLAFLPSPTSGLRARGSAVLALPRSVCQLLLLISSDSSQLCTELTAACMSSFLRTATSFALLLADATAAIPDRSFGFSRPDWLAVARPSLVRPVLDLLIEGSARATLDALVPAIDAGVVPMCVRWFGVLVSSEYAAHRHAPQADRKLLVLQEKIVKILRCVVMERQGMKAIVELDAETVNPLYAFLGPAIAGLFDPHMLDAEPESEKVDGRVSMGLRSLRLATTLLAEKRCRTLTTDAGLLASAIVPATCHVILDPCRAPRKETSLLFAAIELAVSDSNIRFKMRDGVFVGDDPARDAPANPFTLIHFLVIIVARLAKALVAPAADLPYPRSMHSFHTGICRRALVLLHENFCHDRQVLATLCACPVAVFGDHAGEMDLHLFRRADVDVASIVPALFSLVTAIPDRTLDLDLDLGLDGESPPPDDPDAAHATAMAAAAVLEDLSHTPEFHRQLIYLSLLNPLSASLIDHPPPLAAILVRVLGRTLTSADTLQEMVAHAGFTAVLSPLIKARGSGASGNHLATLMDLAARHHDTIALPIAALFDFSRAPPGSDPSRSAIADATREKAALALVHVDGPTLVKRIAAPHLATLPGEISEGIAASALEILFELACGVGAEEAIADSGGGLEDAGETEDDEDENGLPALARDWIARRVDVASIALKQLALVVPAVLRDLPPPPPPPPRAPQSLWIDQILSLPPLLHTQPDVVRFAFPDDPTDTPPPLAFPRLLLATGSGPLHALVAGGYAESAESLITLLGVDRDTWSLVLAHIQLSAAAAAAPAVENNNEPLLPVSSDLARILLLAQVADRFLIEPLHAACLCWILDAVGAAARVRAGRRALVVARWAVRVVQDESVRMLRDGCLRALVVGCAELPEVGALQLTDIFEICGPPQQYGRTRPIPGKSILAAGPVFAVRNVTWRRKAKVARQTRFPRSSLRRVPSTRPRPWAEKGDTRLRVSWREEVRIWRSAACERANANHAGAQDNLLACRVYRGGGCIEEEGVTVKDARANARLLGTERSPSAAAVAAAAGRKVGDVRSCRRSPVSSRLQGSKVTLQRGAGQKEKK